MPSSSSCEALGAMLANRGCVGAGWGRLAQHLLRTTGTGLLASVHPEFCRRSTKIPQNSEAGAALDYFTSLFATDDPGQGRGVRSTVSKARQARFALTSGDSRVTSRAKGPDTGVPPAGGRGPEPCPFPPEQPHALQHARRGGGGGRKPFCVSGCSGMCKTTR